MLYLFQLYSQLQIAHFLLKFLIRLLLFVLHLKTDFIQKTLSFRIIRINVVFYSFLKSLHLLNQLVHQGFVVIGERIVADHLMDMFLNLAEYCRTSLRLGCLDDLQNLLKEGVIHLGVINGIIVLPLSILDFHHPGRQAALRLAATRNRCRCWQ